MSEQTPERTEGDQPTEQPGGERQPEQPPAEPKPREWDGKVESLPAGAQAMLRELRDENAKARTRADERAQDMARALAKAAGIDLPGEQDKVDPDALVQQLSASQSAQRDATVQLAVYRAAGKQSLDPDALLDSRQFLGTVSDLDPTAQDFADKVEAAVKVAADSGRFRAGRAPGASAADAPGGRPSSTLTPGGVSMSDSIAARLQSR